MPPDRSPGQAPQVRHDKLGSIGSGRSVLQHRVKKNLLQSSPVPDAPDSRSVAFAKTTRPQLGAIVARERLFQRMDGAPGRTLVWISGPPGAGKTSLAASYVETRQRRCLWYEMDTDDADVATFFHYFGHAALRLDAERIGSLPTFAPENGSRLASFARRFFRQALTRVKAPLTVVLDGLGPMPAESPLFEVLEAAVAQVPSGGCVIVTSRFDPPAALARLQASGEMVRIDAGMLNVEPDELAQIAKLRGQALSTEAVSQLHQRTGGWAAGLVLMLEHSKLSGALPNWPEESTPRVVFDFLAGEIFDRFELKMQQFLLRLACLPRVTARLAQQLTGEEKATRLLLNLALNNYFVSEVRWPEGQGFQLHPLMRDFLLNRAALDLPEVLEAPHLRLAAGLLRESGQVEDAVALLIRCRDWTLLAEVAADEARTMIAQGRGDTLALWLEALPPATLAAAPRLDQAYAITRLAASPRTARRHFERAFEAYGGLNDVAAQLQCGVGVIDALINEFDDLAALDLWRQRLAAMLPGARALLARDDCDAAQVAILRASLLRPAQALPGQQAAIDAAPRWVRAALALWQGDWGTAAALLEGRTGGDAQESSQAALRGALVASLAGLVSGQFALARERALEGLRLTEQEGAAGYDAFLHAVVVACALSEDDADLARAQLQWFETDAAQLRRGDRAILHCLRSWFSRLDGDPVRAQRDARSAVALACELGLVWLECLARCMLALLLAQARDERGSEAQLRSAQLLLSGDTSPLLQVPLALAMAGVAVQNQQLPQALAALGDAFHTGREYAVVHMPGWSAQDAAEMCVLALQHGIEPDYARRLVRERKLSPKVPPLLVKSWPWPIRIHTLGRFEIAAHDTPVEFSGKGPGRPAELLKLLVSLGAQAVRVYQLADALWPHVDADFAHKSFTAALHRLRRLLDDDEAVLLRDGRLSLHPDIVWTDTWALDQVLSEIENATRLPTARKRPDPALRESVQQALALYPGPFLPDESEHPGYIAFREQLRARLLRCVARAARHWEEAGDFDTAADFYLQLLQADSMFEAPYRNLMLCYQRHGDVGAARDVYERLRTTLSMRLKIMPSAQTQAVYAGLDASMAAVRASGPSTMPPDD